MTRHLIDERWCDVKFPDSQLQQVEVVRKKEDQCKIFVARISETIKADDLREHFDQFGQVTDVFYPEPFRSFAFVTFVEAKVAQSLIGKDHVVKGCSVHIGPATPKVRTRGGQGGGGGVGQGGPGYGGAYPGGDQWTAPGAGGDAAGQEANRAYYY
jgi:hypothetical protein